ncbi:MAG: hypothetical protein MOB07_31475 [Acidobacteria bacterium]|nr:hypothetical protein [Acidobacteriota bacterium]
MAVIRNEAGDITMFICSRPNKKRCLYCTDQHTVLCDGPMGAGKTCSTPMCGVHTWSPEPEKDYCRQCRRKIEAPEREAKRLAELEARKRETLIFIAQSKFAGTCKDQDCGARWEQGQPMYWDKQTRETFCSECGELMSPY